MADSASNGTPVGDGPVRRGAEASVPWARGSSTAERATVRVRQPVSDLPSWEPLPPGETLVRRPSTT